MIEHRSHTSRGASAGFSLIELIVVMAILAIALAIAVPRHAKTASKPVLLATAFELAASLGAVRAQAIGRNQDQEFVLDLTSKSYSSSSSLRALPPGVSLSFETAQDTLRATSEARLIFYPTGGSSGGRIVLSTNQGRVIITVEWLTGMASVERDAS